MNFSYSLDNSDFGRDQRIGQASVPWTDALEATAQDAWVHNPNTELGDTTDLYLAQHPEWRDTAAGVAGIVQATPGLSTVAGALFSAPLNAAEKSINTPASADEFIDAHTLNQQYGESLGLSFDQPQRRGAVDIMVNARKQQMQRDFTLAHAPSGMAFKAASLGTSLAVSAADPLNVAAAFVPIVGEARYGMWAARVGPTLARVGQGAIEGAVGTAALQPIEATRDAAFQDEYGPMDAFLNVTFGSLLGGGLHAGVGALSDLLGRLHPETREAALRGAVGQMADGRDVDVEAPLRSDPAFNEPDSVKAKAPEEIIPAANDTNGLPPDLPREEITPERLDSEERAISDKVEQLSPQAQEALQSHGFEPAQIDLGGEQETPRGVQAPDAGQQPQPAGLGRGEATVRATEGSSAVSAKFDDALSRARENAISPPPSSATSPDASRAADEAIKAKSGDDIDAEHQQALAQVDAYEKQGILSPELAAAARAGSEDIKNAARDGNAAKAAARCLLLHP